MSLVERLDAQIRECQRLRAENASLRRGLTLPGWFCTCGIFNGESKDLLHECRACGAPKEGEHG